MLEKRRKLLHQEKRFAGGPPLLSKGKHVWGNIARLSKLEKACPLRNAFNDKEQRPENQGEKKERKDSKMGGEVMGGIC